MSRILNEGEFRRYAFSARLDHALGEIKHSALYEQRKVSVFISHKHDDLEDLKGLIGFLEKAYDIEAYIDSEDSSLPKKPSVETAQRIKERIKQCDKFLFLATAKAIESKWCNWELGYGDAMKYKNKMAFFPMKAESALEKDYVGNEYMKIYPYVIYHDGTERYSDTKKIIQKGYYVKNCRDKPSIIVPLAKWLKE